MPSRLLLFSLSVFATLAAATAQAAPDQMDMTTTIEKI